MFADGLAQQVIELFLRAFQGLLPLRLELQSPVGFEFKIAVLPLQNVSGRQLFNTLHECVRAGYIVEGKVVMEAGKVQISLKFRMSENGFQLGPEIEFAGV